MKRLLLIVGLLFVYSISWAAVYLNKMEFTPCEHDTISLTVTGVGDKFEWCAVEAGVEKPVTNAFNEEQKQVYCSKIGVNKSLHLRHKSMKFSGIKLEKNLLDNGDFEDGTSSGGSYNGFSSSYIFFGLDASFPAKTSPADGYYRLCTQGLNGRTPDPQQGGKYFLECDGDSNENAIAYSARVKTPIKEGESYQFSYMAATTCTADPIYGQEYGKITFWLVMYDNSGNLIESHKLLEENEIDNQEWKTFGEGVYWTAPRNCDHVEIHLTNAATSYGANDFGLDNIMFQHCEVDGDIEQEDFIITPQECVTEEVVKVVIKPEEAPFVWEAGNNISYDESGRYVYSYKMQDENGSWYVVKMILELQIGDELDVTDDLREDITEDLLDELQQKERVKLKPMKIFTPNGDGVNDVWLIDGIENYPESLIEIYDRFQRKILQVNGKDFTGWDGYYNKHLMQNDDYWFVIITYGYDQTITGHFLLKR